MLKAYVYVSFFVLPGTNRILVDVAWLSAAWFLLENFDVVFALVPRHPVRLHNDQDRTPVPRVQRGHGWWRR